MTNHTQNMEAERARNLRMIRERETLRERVKTLEAQARKVPLLESQPSWRPIDTLFMMRIDHPWVTTGFRIFAPSLIDADFNQSGTAEAARLCNDPNSAIVAAKWNDEQDCWDTVEVRDATHWMPFPDPPKIFPESTKDAK